MEESKIKLAENIKHLTAGQIRWLDGVLQVFNGKHEFKLLQPDILDEHSVSDFGEALRIHHSFSAEAFSKDKFEYVLADVLNANSKKAVLAPKGNRGHDLTIDGVTVSLKTQADRDIKDDRIWISKFMELGKGKWEDDPSDLEGLRQEFLEHMKNYERIFTLRALSREPDWLYELVEIPKSLLLLASSGTLEMKTESRQFPKPGYCYVQNQRGEQLFQLYFDGGGERKLQVKHLLKNQCIVHATWEFTI